MYRRPIPMIVLLVLSTLLGISVLCSIPFLDFYNPYIQYGQIIMRRLTVLQIGLCVSGLIVVLVMNLMMIIGYAAKRTKVVSIISTVFIALAFIDTWLMGLGYNELQIYPNDPFLIAIWITLVSLLSLAAAIIGIVKSYNPEKEKIIQLTQEIEKLKNKN